MRIGPARAPEQIATCSVTFSQPHRRLIRLIGSGWLAVTPSHPAAEASQHPPLPKPGLVRCEAREPLVPLGAHRLVVVHLSIIHISRRRGVVRNAAPGSPIPIPLKLNGDRSGPWLAPSILSCFRRRGASRGSGRVHVGTRHRNSGNFY